MNRIHKSVVAAGMLTACLQAPAAISFHWDTRSVAAQASFQGLSASDFKTMPQQPFEGSSVNLLVTAQPVSQGPQALSLLSTTVIQLSADGDEFSFSGQLLTFMEALQGFESSASAMGEFRLSLEVDKPSIFDFSKTVSSAAGPGVTMIDHQVSFSAAPGEFLVPGNTYVLSGLLAYEVMGGDASPRIGPETRFALHISAVPESRNAALMLSGLLLVGATVRARRRGPGASTP